MTDSARILVIDNYDSFVYTIVGYLKTLGATVTVVRNDAIDPSQPGVLPIRLLLVLLLVFAAAASCFEWLFPWAASTIPMLQEMSNYTAI